jgi:ABC-type sugar transport system substrate-binding protein
MNKRSLIVLTVVIVFTMIAPFSFATGKKEATTEEELEKREKADYIIEEEGGAAEEEAAAERKEKILIGWSFTSLISLFWQAQEDHVKAYSEKMGYDYIITASEDNASKQDSAIKDLIARNCDAIIVIPADQEAICGSIDAVNAAGIPCLSMSRSPACLDKVLYDVGSDSYEFAEIIVDWLAEKADREGIEINMLLLVGDLRDNNAVLRRNGVIEKAPQYDNINVVAEVPTEWNLDKALSGTTNTLQANPEINCIFVPSDYLLPSVIASLQAANKLYKSGHPKHIILATIDGDPYGTSQIRAGYVDIDVAHDPWGWVEMATDAAVKLINGRKLPAKKEVQIPLVASRNNVNELGNKLWGNVYEFK